MAATVNVSNTSNAYRKMAPMWKMINALLGGTADMRAQSRDYLPQYGGESDDNYKNRLNRAVLYNAYGETSKKMTNRPFSKPLVVNDLNPALKNFIDDIDLQGNDLHKFTRNIFGDALDHGLSAIMVDFPVVDASQIQTIADENAMGARPYFVHIKAENIIAAYAEVINGVETLTHVRIKEAVVKRDGFDEVVEENIRVLEPGSVVIWKKVKDKWEPGPKFETQLKYIPMVIYYTDREDLCLARPPLLDLAFKNIEHWQGASDQNNCLTVARFPILAASGVTLDEGKKVIGPRSLLRCGDASGKFYYVEHSGAALNAGKDDLDVIKDEMMMMGIQLLRKPGGETATKTQHDTQAQLSDLEAMIVDLEDSIEAALKMMLDWIHVDMNSEEDAGEVEIFKDFAIGASEGKDLDFLFKMRNVRELSREAFITEVKRRGVLSDNYDPEADQELIDQEAPGLPAPIGVPPTAKVPPSVGSPASKDKVPAVPPKAPSKVN